MRLRYSVFAGKTSPAAFLIQALSIIALITYSSFYLASKSQNSWGPFCLCAYIHGCNGDNRDSIVVLCKCPDLILSPVQFRYLFYSDHLPPCPGKPINFCGLLSVAGYSVLFRYSYHSSLCCFSDYLFD